MTSSPRTPTRAENRFTIDSSPNGYSNGYARSTRSRKSSLCSPITPRPQSANGMNGVSTATGDFAGLGDGGNGRGSLADELAEAWDEDGESEEGGSEQPMAEQGVCADFETSEEPETSRTNHQVYGTTSSPAQGRGTNGYAISKKVTGLSRTRRKRRQYDGSDHDDDSDFEQVSSVSPLLEGRMATIEGLARQGTEENEAQGDGVIGRVVDGLRDLGAQSSVENGTTRLITAHTALASHVAHQTRMLQTLAYPLLSPLSTPLDHATIDDLLPLLTETSSTTPQPTTSALSSLLHLSTYTIDLITTLNHLSDTIHMSRQTITQATRRLRSARELVAEIQRDTKVRDEGVDWIEKGDWQTRLADRECAGVCTDVVGGFEEVCRGWRERLVASASAEVGAA